jgi:hydrogenase expression/formation protein HypE
MKITMEHGSGGLATGRLISEIFEKSFDNPVLSEMEDSAVVAGSGRLAMTTDSFVVDPLEYPGGDIGRLCICGTVNDLLMRGSVPRYLTCGFILQEGADTEQLKRITASMAATAKEAGITIVAGDTKVVQGNGGMFINTAGVGFLPEGREISSTACVTGDVIIVSGTLGEHHAAILSSRMKIENSIGSDNAPLTEMVGRLMDSGLGIHTMRDVTRGGLATVLRELAEAGGVSMEIEQKDLPVDRQVESFCGLLGLDPLYMGNEGKLVAMVSAEDADRAVEIIRDSRYGENACVIGRVAEKCEGGRLTLLTRIGGRRRLEILQGEGLPRIC